MKFVSDPPIAQKIRKMNQRVRWGDRILQNQKIDQTRFVLDDHRNTDESFSFLVIGDTGTGVERRHNPQRRVAEEMLKHLDQTRFVLHTGDVVYLVGSSEYYYENFIHPYREWLVGGNQPKKLSYDNLTFKTPIFPVLGNHDYYDLPLLNGLFTGLTLPLRRVIKFQLDFDMGWHGSYQGKAYAEAFLDYLCRFSNPESLRQHLDQHYTAKTETGRCLRYQPEKFTRLPNRYYQFRYGGIDFFALDSNTFNSPIPIPNTPEGKQRRLILEQQRQDLEQQKQQLLIDSQSLDPNSPEESDRLSELRAKYEQIEEVQLDIDKQLNPTVQEIDLEQLHWLEKRLIESWHHPDVRGRILFLHHPPYVTEATKWHQAQTLAVRQRLRQVFDSVDRALEISRGKRPIVDLVLTGHAHCLEYLNTFDTGHADSLGHWLVCGGSGYSLRRQREEGPELFEPETQRAIAKAQLFIGRNGQGVQKRRPYSFLRIDVQPGNPPRYLVTPQIVERLSSSAYSASQLWHTYTAPAIAIEF